MPFPKFLEAGAAIKRLFADACDGVRDGDLGEAGAATKHLVADAGDGVRDPIYDEVRCHTAADRGLTQCLHNSSSMHCGPCHPCSL